MGFLSTGITAGSSAAIWMASLGNVPVGSIFSIIQSISTWGMFLFLNPYILLLECIFSLCFGIYFGYKYDFDVNNIINELKKYIPYINMIINISFSIIIDGVLGIIISILIIFILYLLFLIFKKIINYIRNNKNGYIRIGNENINKNISDFWMILLIIIAFIFILINFIYGIYLGYNFPFEIL
jgi:hypothetical protein